MDVDVDVYVDVYVDVDVDVDVDGYADGYADGRVVRRCGQIATSVCKPVPASLSLGLARAFDG